MQDDLKYYFWAGSYLITVAILLPEVTNEKQKSGVGFDCSLQVFSIRGHMNVNGGYGWTRTTDLSIMSAAL